MFNILSLDGYTYKQKVQYQMGECLSIDTKDSTKCRNSSNTKDFKKQIEQLKKSGQADNYYRIPENTEDVGIAKIHQDEAYKRQVRQFSVNLYYVMRRLEKQQYQIVHKGKKYKLQVIIDQLEKERRQPSISYLRQWNTKVLYNYCYQKAKYYYYQGQYKNTQTQLTKLSKQAAQILKQADISVFNIKIFLLMANMNLPQISLKELRQQSVCLIINILQEKIVQQQKYLRQQRQKALFVCLLYYIILLKKTYIFKQQLVANCLIQEIESVSLKQIKQQYQYLIDLVRSYRLQLIPSIRDKVIKGSYLVQVQKNNNDKSSNWQQLITQLNNSSRNLSSVKSENPQKIDYNQLFVPQQKIQNPSQVNSNKKPKKITPEKVLQQFYVLNLSNLFIAKKNEIRSGQDSYSTWIKTYQNKTFQSIPKQKYQAYESKALMIKIKQQSKQNRLNTVDYQKLKQKLTQFLQIIISNNVQNHSKKNQNQLQIKSDHDSKEKQVKEKVKSPKNATNHRTIDNNDSVELIQQPQSESQYSKTPIQQTDEQNRKRLEYLKQNGIIVSFPQTNTDQNAQKFNSNKQTRKQEKKQQQQPSTKGHCKIQQPSNPNSSSILHQQNNWKRNHPSSNIQQFQYNQKNMIYGYKTSSNQKQCRRGLRNLGNTCYMNSALQCLHKSKHFSQHFISKVDRIKQKSKGRGQYELTEAYEEFIQQMWKTNDRREWQRNYAYEPRRIKQIMGKNFEIFKHYDQNDATQFFNYFIKQIQQELNQPTNNQFQEIDHYNQRSRAIYQKIKYNQETYEKSIIEDIFTGRYKVVFSSTDTRCSHTYTSFDKFNVHVLQLPQTRSNRVDLQQCLSLFNKPEILRGDDVSYCDICQREMFDNKTIQIYEANKIFAVNFKRFLNHRKNQTIVQAPKYLDLSPFVVESERPKFKGKKYRLYAGIVHSGSLNGGHYYAYCYNYKAGKWMEYNDSSVYEVDQKQVDLRGATTLFYELEQDKNQQLVQTTFKRIKGNKKQELLYNSGDKKQELLYNSDIEHRKQLGKDGRVILSVMNWLIRSSHFKRMFQQRLQKWMLNTYPFINLLHKAIQQSKIDNDCLEQLLDFRKRISANDPYQKYKFSQIPNFIFNVLSNIDQSFKSESEDKIVQQLTAITRLKIQKCGNYHSQKYSSSFFQKIHIEAGKQQSNIINDYFSNYRQNNIYHGNLHKNCSERRMEYQLLKAGPVLMVELREREKYKQYINIPAYLSPKTILKQYSPQTYADKLYKLSSVIERKGKPECYQYSMSFYDFQQHIWFQGSKNQVVPVGDQHGVPAFHNAYFLVYELKDMLGRK